jgi:hypothetical protein
MFGLPVLMTSIVSVIIVTKISVNKVFFISVSISNQNLHSIS